MRGERFVVALRRHNALRFARRAAPATRGEVGCSSRLSALTGRHDNETVDPSSLHCTATHGGTPVRCCMLMLCDIARARVQHRWASVRGRRAAVWNHFTPADGSLNGIFMRGAAAPKELLMATLMATCCSQGAQPRRFEDSAALEPFGAGSSGSVCSAAHCGVIFQIIAHWCVVRLAGLLPSRPALLLWRNAWVSRDGTLCPDVAVLIGVLSF